MNQKEIEKVSNNIEKAIFEKYGPHYSTSILGSAFQSALLNAISNSTPEYRGAVLDSIKKNADNFYLTAWMLKDHLNDGGTPSDFFKKHEAKNGG